MADVTVAVLRRGAGWVVSAWANGRQGGTLDVARSNGHATREEARAAAAWVSRVLAAQGWEPVVWEPGSRPPDPEVAAAWERRLERARRA